MHKYRLVAKKGEGTFSEVLKAQSLKNGRSVAVKCMKQTFVSLDQVNNLREIQAIRRLSPHPNIIRLYEVLYDHPSGRLALVFELMHCNLYELIKGKRQYLPEATVKTLVYQLLRSIDHMHRNGIFHRDIKPENVLLTNDDTVKLADFGSCRGIYSKQPYTEYISTRWYRAPECLLTDGYYGYKMDIWGIGCVIFELLALFPLFPGKDEADQVRKVHDILGTPHPEVLRKFRKQGSHADLNFPPQHGSGIKRLLPHCSPQAVDLIQQMLAYDPEERITARSAMRHPWFADLRAEEKRKRELRKAASSSSGTPHGTSDDHAAATAGSKADSPTTSRREQSGEGMPPTVPTELTPAHGTAGDAPESKSHSSVPGLSMASSGSSTKAPRGHRKSKGGKLHRGLAVGGGSGVVGSFGAAEPTVRSIAPSKAQQLAGGHGVGRFGHRRLAANHQPAAMQPLPSAVSRDASKGAVPGGMMIGGARPPQHYVHQFRQARAAAPVVGHPVPGSTASRSIVQARQLRAAGHAPMPAAPSARQYRLGQRSGVAVSSRSDASARGGRSGMARLPGIAALRSDGRAGAASLSRSGAYASSLQVAAPSHSTKYGAGQLAALAGSGTAHYGSTVMATRTLPAGGSTSSPYSHRVAHSFGHSGKPRR
ncbi:hypothetical protein FNF29_01554 [Cafeteria roenbergensis]|uniref:Protein kinase domain-containing protein n=1 Tax=Cafeteria roenbergensis TaxID=33653 RepID=A0A5A8CT44_CAFRO|nr:hypothetical protein FNF29_01554 [Cafeteria roenbergensis]KAA0158559.1 hypothetical protein FNF28_06180 [Cafeteria roenbergensis]|eukprot:KAA0155637.1 hypothetical protein FNF29_01554 [Cafeteria roenbergensis]